jgi:hypothetical protein
VLSPVLRWQSAGAGAGDQCLDGAPRDRSCARREARGRVRLSRCARGEGFDRFQCSLRPGPAAARGERVGGDGAGDFWVSLVLGFGVSEGRTLGCVVGAGAPRDRSCARREARGRVRLSRCARGEGFDRFQCSLRPGPAAARGERVGGDGAGDFWVSLVLGFGVSEGRTLGCVVGARAPRDRSCARREARGRVRLSRCARGEGFDRFQCSLRSGPAAARGERLGGDGAG